MISWRSSRSSSMQNGELALGAERDASRLHTGAPATAGIPLPAISMPLPATGTPSIGIAMGTAGAGDGVVVSAHHGTDFRWPSPLARGGGVGAIGPDADATGSWSGPPTPRRSNARPRRTDPPAGSFDPLVGSSLTSAWFEIGAGTYEAAGRTRRRDWARSNRSRSRPRLSYAALSGNQETPRPCASSGAGAVQEILNR